MVALLMVDLNWMLLRLVYSVSTGEHAQVAGDAGDVTILKHGKINQWKQLDILIRIPSPSVQSI